MNKFTTLTGVSFLTALLLLLAAVATGNMNIKPVFAQLFDEGASSFAPRGNEPPVAGGWMPMERLGWDRNGAAEDNPGQQGIDAGIIGQPKKIE